MEYKLLVAEDEKICRCSIAAEIQRSVPEFQVFQAENGLEALDIIEKEHIDCMMLDIQMPKMSGIQLLDTLKALGREDILSVVVSGFDKFEYAKKMLQHSVFDYLLKPITPKEIVSICNKLLEKLRARDAEARKINELHMAVEEARPLIRLQLFQNLISGKYTAKELNSQADFLNISLEGPCYLCAVLERQDEKNTGFDQVQIQNLQLEEMIEKCRFGLNVEIFREETNQTVLIFHFGKNARQPFETACSQIHRISRLASDLLGLRLSAGIGTIQTGLQKVGVSYQQAKNALRYTTLYGDTVIYDSTDTNGKARWYSCFDSNEFRAFLKTGNLECAHQNIDQILKSAEDSNIDVTSLNILCNRLQILATQTLDECGIDLLQYYGSDDTHILEMPHMQTFDQIRNWLYEMTDEVVEKIGAVHQEPGTFMVQNVQSYIKANYHRPINIMTIAKDMGYSANYLGSMFRKACDMSINEYINEVRINQAKNLLTTSTYRVSEISDMVGFSGKQYFATVFKKKTGLTPKEYREKEVL